MRVVLTGILGKKFGTDFVFEANRPSQCVSALINMLDGFETYARSHNFNAWVNDNNIRTDQLASSYTNSDTLYLGLHVTGASKKGMGALAVIAGIVLIAVAWWNPLAWGAGAQMIVAGMGAGIAMMGVGMVLMPTASVTGASDNKSSYGFSSLTTTTEQGNCVPVLYGKGLIGGFVIMYRITTEDM